MWYIWHSAYAHIALWWKKKYFALSDLFIFWKLQSQCFFLPFDLSIYHGLCLLFKSNCYHIFFFSIFNYLMFKSTDIKIALHINKFHWNSIWNDDAHQHFVNFLESWWYLNQSMWWFDKWSFYKKNFPLSVQTSVSGVEKIINFGAEISNHLFGRFHLVICRTKPFKWKFGSTKFFFKVKKKKKCQIFLSSGKLFTNLSDSPTACFVHTFKPLKSF